MRHLIERIREQLRRLFFWHENGKRSGEFVPKPAHDHTLVLAVTKPKRLPRWRQIRYAGRVMTRREQRVLAASLLIFFLACGLSAWGIARARLISVPASGGRIIEAVIGSPRYPNPLYASTNDPDGDLVALVYAGLFRRTDGSTVAPDLAERFEWSPDGKQLTVTLRTDVRFHDGTPVTSDDVVFTLNAAKDPAWRSTYAASLRGMTINRVDDRTVSFTLERPDVTLLDTLTIGILPIHLWQDVAPTTAPLADANMRPVGAGPFRVRSFRRDAKGFILAYTLERNARYHGIKPLLNQIEFRYFSDRAQAAEALRGGQVDSFAFVPGSEIADFTKHERLAASAMELPQETIAFLNVNDAVLKDMKVRQALSLAVEREDIVNAQANTATPVSSPFPFAPFTAATSTPEERLDRARALLEQAGWTMPQQGELRVKTSKPDPKAAAAPAASSTVLTLTIEAPNVSDLVSVAEALKKRWSLLGAKVDVKVDEPGTLAQRAVSERKSQIIIWNVLLAPSQDLYAIWWSGEANGRGLNLSALADRNVDDAILATRAATTTDGLFQARERLGNMIEARWPAIFLTRPSYGYVHHKRLQGMSPRLQLGRPSDRFNDVANWYVETGWRWR